MSGSWALVAAMLLLVVAASLPVERFAARAGVPPISAAAVPARALVIGALFLFWLGLFRRPLLAGFATLTTVAITTAVSVRKRQLVAESLVFSDFALLRLVVRHPDLYYIGFMADPRFIAAAAAFVGGLALWIWLEPPIMAALAGLALTMGVLAAIALLWALAHRPTLARRLRAIAPSPSLERDVGRWGLFLTLAVYALRWRAETRQPSAAASPSDTSHLGGPDLVVVVQLESFVDPLRSGLPAIPMPGLARARALASFHGPLEVPSHGAFTMRSEYAVLTGLEPAESGFRQFDPYLSSAGGTPPTLATRLRERGWRTLFLHPFRAGFFNRETVMPRLGFDAFLWEDDFGDAARIGPYVSDVALAERVLAEAAADADPALIVAVTMENHGPWPADRLADEPDATRQYLRHLAGSDRAISTLLDGLAEHPGRALLCLYGDHPPILPGIDRTLPPQTEYAVIELGRGAARQEPSVAVEEAILTAGELGRLILRLAEDCRVVARSPDRSPAA